MDSRAPSYYRVNGVHVRSFFHRFLDTEGVPEYCREIFLGAETLNNTLCVTRLASACKNVEALLLFHHRLQLPQQGLIWREILEFRDGMPARRHKPTHKRRAQKPSSRAGRTARRSLPRISRLAPGKRFNRMVSAFTRQVETVLFGCACCIQI